MLVNDRMFSREAVQEYVKHPEEKHNKHKTIGHFATHSTKKVFMICPLCDGKHDLDECKSFKEKILQERSRFLFEQKSCFGCFSPIYASRNAKNYKKRKESKVCKKKHPTSLHSYKTENSEEKLEKSREEKDNEQKDFQCATVDMKSEGISMCMVPVIIKLSNRVVQTYAMLDTCSQATFAKENLLSHLGIHWRKTSVTVKSMNGEVTKSSETLEDLEVL